MTATYTSRDLAAAAQVNPSAIASNWAPRFGIVGRGSGSRNRYTLGQLIITRALRDWLGGFDPSGVNGDVVRRFCQQGPHLVDDRLPRPRYLVLHGARVTTSDDPAELVAALYDHPALHVIDVELAMRDLAVTPHE